jgi:hypothetical protein
MESEVTARTRAAMENGQRADGGRRQSRRPRTGSRLKASRERFLSLDPILRAGSVAAALGSVIALFLTVGNGVKGLFGHDSGAPRVHIDSVELEKMDLRTFLVTKEHQKPPFGYSKRELGRDVVVANIDAQYERSSRGVSFPATLTLESRASDGRVHPVQLLELNYTLDASDDTCGCHQWFKLPSQGREYRLDVEILRPSNAAHPPALAHKASDWYQR